MIEANTPEINVDELMHKIREEVAKRHSYSHSSISDSLKAAQLSALKSFTDKINTLVSDAESRAYTRNKWPDKLNRFPFNLSTRLQKLVLKILELVFIDQREVNLNLIRSLKESVAINQQLIAQIASLQLQMEEQLGAMNGHIQRLDEYLDVVDGRLQGLDERHFKNDM